MTMGKLTRKFNNKLYYLQSIVWSKREALKQADKFRKEGKLARIVRAVETDAFGTTGEGWSIYTRRAK
jgi:hypothetical protein